MKYKKYPQIINPETGEVDCLATQLAGMYVDEAERERKELEAMKRQHELDVAMLSREKGE